MLHQDSERYAKGTVREMGAGPALPEESAVFGRIKMSEKHLRRYNPGVAGRVLRRRLPASSPRARRSGTRRSLSGPDRQRRFLEGKWKPVYPACVFLSEGACAAHGVVLAGSQLRGFSSRSAGGLGTYVGPDDTRSDIHLPRTALVYVAAQPTKTAIAERRYCFPIALTFTPFLRPRGLRQLGALRAGDIAELDGYLVEVQMAHGGKWISSLTRTDVGAGACELM